MVLTPGNETMAALNWVWPPLLLALTGWMFLQVRRSVTGRARWALAPVLAVLALASLGATYGDLAGADDPGYPAPGRLYDVGGHRLHLDCHGHGSPTVVLSNGLGETSASWARITAPVAATTRVCAYDRAGQGWSDESRQPAGRRPVGRGPAHAPRRRPASTAPTCWSGTPPAAPTR